MLQWILATIMASAANTAALVSRDATDCCPYGPFVDSLAAACVADDLFGDGQCIDGYLINCQRTYGSGDILDSYIQDPRDLEACKAFCDNVPGTTALSQLELSPLNYPGSFDPTQCQCLRLAGELGSSDSIHNFGSSMVKCSQSDCCQPYFGDLADVCTGIPSYHGYCVDNFIIACGVEPLSVDQVADPTPELSIQAGYTYCLSQGTQERPLTSVQCTPSSLLPGYFDCSCSFLEFNLQSGTLTTSLLRTEYSICQVSPGGSTTSSSSSSAISSSSTSASTRSSTGSSSSSRPSATTTTGSSTSTTAIPTTSITATTTGATSKGEHYSHSHTHTHTVTTKTHGGHHPSTGPGGSGGHGGSGGSGGQGSAGGAGGAEGAGGAGGAGSAGGQGGAGGQGRAGGAGGTGGQEEAGGAHGAAGAAGAPGAGGSGTSGGAGGVGGSGGIGGSGSQTTSSVKGSSTGAILYLNDATKPVFLFFYAILPVITLYL